LVEVDPNKYLEKIRLDMIFN